MVLGFSLTTRGKGDDHEVENGLVATQAHLD